MSLVVFVTVVAAVILFLLGMLSWSMEPRILLYLFHRMAYSVHRGGMFIDDIDANFPQCKQVESNAGELRAEAMRLLDEVEALPKAHEMDKYNDPISALRGPSWRTLYLRVYSGWFHDNCKRCPVAYRLFRDMDNVVAVMYSVMDPGNRIPPHRGELVGFLRYQLPLVVPKSGYCAITVGGETRNYVEGKGILFDDANEHSVVNETDEHRVVLFFDVRKKSGRTVEALDRFFMWLVATSPRFQRATASAK